MKKHLIAILAVSLMTLAAVPAFATTTPYVCPNGNTTCIQAGSCPQNGVCQYPDGCPNGGVPKRDGTGNPNGARGGGRGNGTGAGRCGVGRNR